MQSLDIDDAALGLLGYLHAALVQLFGVGLEEAVRHVVHLALGLHGLLGVVQRERKGHLALPERDGVHNGGAYLLRHDGIVILYHAYLRGHLDRHHARKLQVVQLFLEPAEHVGVVVRGLRVLGLAGLLCDLLEPGQLGLAQLLAAEFAGDDVHGQLLVVLLIHLVHLVHHGDVLHKRQFVLLKLLCYLVHVDLGLVILGLEGGYALPLFFEKAEEAFFLLLVEVHALKLDNEIGKLVAHLAEVLGAHLAQRSV